MGPTEATWPSEKGRRIPKSGGLSEARACGTQIMGRDMSLKMASRSARLHLNKTPMAPRLEQCRAMHCTSLLKCHGTHLTSVDIGQTPMAVTPTFFCAIWRTLACEGCYASFRSVGAGKM